MGDSWPTVDRQLADRFFRELFFTITVQLVDRERYFWPWSLGLTTRIIVAVILRGKERLKEGEEAWLKIDELARKNTNVSTLDCQIRKDKSNNQL